MSTAQSATVDIALAVSLLQAVLSSLQLKGAAPATIDAISAAVSKLLEVEGTDVTYGQLESLRVAQTF